MEEYNQERREKSTAKLEVIRRTLETSPGLSNRAVAREMGISEAYVRKLKAQL